MSAKRQRLLPSTPVTTLPLSIPRTLWQSIFQFLDLLAHLSLQSACKSLNFIGRDACSWLESTPLTIYLGHRLHVNGFPVPKKHLKDEHAVLKFARSLRFVRASALEVYMFRANPHNVTLSQIMTWLPYPLVKKLQLRILGLQNHVALSSLSQCTQLQHLSISMNSPTLEAALPPWITPAHPENHIKTFKFKFDSNIMGLAPEMDMELCSLPRIKAVTLHNMNLAFARNPWPLFACNTTLTSLDLRRCLLGDDAVQFIRKMPRLGKLALYDMKRRDIIKLFTTGSLPALTDLSLIRSKLNRNDLQHISNHTLRLSRLTIVEGCLASVQFAECMLKWTQLTYLKLGPEAISCKVLPLLFHLTLLSKLELYNLSLPIHQLEEPSPLHGLSALASHLVHLKLNQVYNICEHDLHAISQLGGLKTLEIVDSPLGSQQDLSCFRKLAALTSLRIGSDSLHDVHFVQLFLASRPLLTFPHLTHVQIDNVSQAMAFLVISQLPPKCSCRLSVKSSSMQNSLEDPELEDALHDLFDVGEDEGYEEDNAEQTVQMGHEQASEENVMMDRQLQEYAQHNGLQSLTIEHVAF